MSSATSQQIATALSSVPEVEGVYIIPGDAFEGVKILTVVDKEDDRVYELIYAKELQLWRDLPAAQFDFSIVARRGRPIEEIVGQNRAFWQRLD